MVHGTQTQGRPNLASLYHRGTGCCFKSEVLKVRLGGSPQIPNDRA